MAFITVRIVVREVEGKNRLTIQKDSENTYVFETEDIKETLLPDGSIGIKAVMPFSLVGDLDIG
jgi:hypothetical protein